MTCFITRIIHLSKQLGSSAPSLLQIDSGKYLLTQSCNYAARRGTRERKLKYLRQMKARAEARRALLIPQHRKKTKGEGNTKGPVRVLDHDKEEAVDNVWFADMFKIREFTYDEALQAHREAHQPEVYNAPNAPLFAFIELDMSLDKKTKFHSNFTGLVPVKYTFKHGEERSILAFCKTIDQINEVTDAGATLAGGADIIKGIKKGRITLPDFQFIIAHPNVAAELIAIRGLLRLNFPTIENGMMVVDMLELIEKIKKGVRYQAVRDETEPNYGYVNVRFGNLNMPADQLEDNLAMILKHVKSQAPKRAAEVPFITRCFLSSPVTNEKFKISFERFIFEEPKEEESDDEDELAQVVQSGKKAGARK